MPRGVIYKITSPSGKIYIGQTINIDVRTCKYKNLNCINQFRLYKSIKKYTWEQHIIEVIEETDVESLDEKEIKWIKFYNSFKIGLNCTEGGRGTKGKPVSEETKLKMRNSHLGLKHSPETIAKRTEKLKGKKRNQKFKERLREAHLGKIVKESTKDKLRLINTGKKLSEETKKKISQSSKGRIVSQETRDKIGKANSKKKII